MFLDRGTFSVLPLTYAYLPNLSKYITFVAAPPVLTPFVRHQGAHEEHAAGRNGHAGGLHDGLDERALPRLGGAGRGDDTVGNPHRAQTSQFELFELILLFLKLDKRFPVEPFEATGSRSTVPSPPLRSASCGAGSWCSPGGAPLSCSCGT